MSNNSLFIPVGFPKAPLANGIGRWVCQLQRITFKFCKNYGSSRGMREFLEFDLLDFAKQNPGVVVYLKPRRHKAPNLTAEYLNGGRQVVDCRNFSYTEVKKWVALLRTQSGMETVCFMKMWHTDHPSVQGPWNPFVNRDHSFNVGKFPCEELSKPVYIDKSATEKLIEIFEEQQRIAIQSKNE